MSNKGQIFPQGHISSLIAKREDALHKDLHEAETAFADYLENVVKVISTEMIYDYHDKFLNVTFSVFFPKDAGKDTKVEVKHEYYTSAEKDSETAKTAKVSVPSFTVTQDTIEYFYTRTMTTHEKIKQNFTTKKLEAYNCNMDVLKHEDGITYKLEVLYILGAQKNKP